MSTSLINTVRTISPAYNPFYLVLNSTNKTNVGFNYVVDLYEKGSSTILRRFRIQPDPLNSNYGYIDISKSLSNQLSDEPLLNIPFSAITENSYQSFKYTLQYGEEYQYTWDFYDNFYNADPYYTNYVGFTSMTQTHQYQVGDYVYITQAAGYTEAGYNGAHMVIYVPNAYSFVINYPFISSTPVNSGTTRYLDYRKILYTGLTSSTGLIYDGAFDYDFYTYDWYDTYYAKPTLPLSNLPIYSVSQIQNKINGYSIKLTNNGYFNIVAVPGQMKDMLIKCYTNDGTLLRTLDIMEPSDVPAYTDMPLILHIPFGPASINNHIGYNFISGDTSYYSITLNDSGGTINYMNEYFIGIDKDCLVYKNTEILFEDLLGSFIPVNVYGTKENVSISRTTYKKYQKYGMGNNTKTKDDYIYDPQSQTNKINSINIDHTYTVNTGYLKEDMVAVIENLMYSKNVYVNWNNTGVYYPIEIVDNGFERKKKETRGTNLIDYTFSYKISNTRALNI